MQALKSRRLWPTAEAPGHVPSCSRGSPPCIDFLYREQAIPVAVGLVKASVHSFLELIHGDFAVPVAIGRINFLRVYPLNRSLELTVDQEPVFIDVDKEKSIGHPPEVLNAIDVAVVVHISGFDDTDSLYLVCSDRLFI